MQISQTRDFELLARLNKPIQELHASLYPDQFREYNFNEIRESFREWVKNEDFIFLVLENDQAALGYAWIEIKFHARNAFIKQRQSVYVHHISLGEDQQKKGYGSYLMNHIYLIAKEKGIDLVELDYWVNNEQARNFYNRQGFLNRQQIVYKNL